MLRSASDANLIPTFNPLNQAVLKLLSHGGVNLAELPMGATLEVKTAHRTYLVEKCENDEIRISGHPKYCPEPVLVHYFGATDDTPMLQSGSIAPGMQMEFWHPTLGMIRTSRVQELQQLFPSTHTH